MTRLSLAFLIVDDALDPDALRAGLSAVERDYHANIRHDGRRREYLASRWLLRHHLAGECDIAPQSLAIEYPASAAPRCGQLPYLLGLSHSGASCLSLVATAPAGCDIEQIRARRFAPARLARHCFHADEVAELRRASRDDQATDFHRLWTLKEAALKSQGLGLAAGMTQPSFRLRPALACTRTRDATPWFFATTELERAGERFAVGLATPRRAATIDLVALRPAGMDRVARTSLVVDWSTAAYTP